ncbi:unnamed protein product [Prunus armeniaca]|uniref:Uncharacterized protein n=1 Tax=Prunus armeniaca TaxID=36596 RepID=A0A6J5VE86_PRUAR|nr:unnamed protein product [Prunus armeniaca]
MGKNSWCVRKVSQYPQVTPTVSFHFPRLSDPDPNPNSKSSLRSWTSMILWTCWLNVPLIYEVVSKLQYIDLWGSKISDQGNCWISS